MLSSKFTFQISFVYLNSLPLSLTHIPYSQKNWQGIKFGSLVVCLKIRQFFSVCIYIWRYRTIPPNLNPPIVLKMSFGAKLPNLMTANISGYTVYPLLLSPFLSQISPANQTPFLPSAATAASETAGEYAGVVPNYQTSTDYLCTKLNSLPG